MNYSLSSKRILLLFLATALVLTFGRLIKSQFNFSYFIVAGSDFVNQDKTIIPVVIQKGQGYDGQFFYRYALNPIDFNKNDYGVNVDHPPYRIQRIAYPLFAWFLSFGGYPAAVPIALVLLNMLAFIGISFYTNKFITLVNGNIVYGLLPLFLSGIFMSIARDLSEVTELFFFTGAIYYLFKPRYLLFSIFATFTLLSHETSMIAFIPLGACLIFRMFRKEFKPPVLFYLLLPFLIFAIWKIIIYFNIPALADTTIRYESIGLPFKGIIMGLKANFNFSDTINSLQFFFWIAYIFWQISFVTMIFRKVSFKQLSGFDNISMLKIIYLSWLILALCLSDNIYSDDWGFVRIFSLWNMVGFLIIIADKKQIGWKFNVFSAMLVLFTIIRLIIRV